MRRIRRSFSRRRGGNRRAMEWFGAHTSPTGTPGEFGLVGLAGTPGPGVNDWIITPDECEEFFDEPTLVRSVIQEGVQLLTTPAATALTVAGWMGIIVTGGQGNVPDPSITADRADYDWVWWTAFCLGNTGNGDTVLSPGAYNTIGGDQFDIRSKRKLASGHGLAFYLTFSGINNRPIGLAFQGRFLFANK